MTSPVPSPRWTVRSASGPRRDRTRADVEGMLAEFRADAARERDDLRDDLRARAERAEHEADTYRAEPDRIREAATAATG